MKLDEYLKVANQTQKTFGEKVGLTQAMISKIVLGECPAERVLSVASACEWKVTPHELRPDLYPHPQDGLPEHLRVTEVKKAVA